MVKYEKYKLKNGETKWKFDGYAGLDPKTKRPVKLRKRNFNTKAQAKLTYERMIEEFNNSQYAPKEKDIRFSEMYEQFLDYYRNTGVTPGTIKKFTTEVNLHVLPIIGDYYLKSISVKDCQELVEFVRKRRKDFRKVLGHPRAIFNYAIQEGYINENPLSKVVIRTGKVNYPQKRLVTSKDNYYTPMQLMKFLEIYEKHGPFMQYVFFRLLGFSGLRRGEALALYKKDLNYNDTSITVNKTLSEGGKSKSTYISYFTKTGDSNSQEDTRVYLDDYTFNLLDELIKKTVFHFGNNQTKYLSATKFLFTSPVSETYYNRGAANDWLLYFWNKHEEELKEAGLHYITPHGFRHSQATLLHELGINPKDAQNRLRHKNLKTTLDIYTHISKDRDIETKNKLNDFQLDRTKNRTNIINIDEYRHDNG